MPYSTRPRDVVEAVPTAIVIVDRNGRIETVNTTAERVFGYPRSELLSQSIEMLVPEQFRHRHASLRSAFFGDPESRPMGAGRDLYGRRKDGSEFPIEIGLDPFESDHGVMVLASIVDISARKRLERQLLETTELLSATLDAAPFPIVVVAPDGRILVFNRAGERIFGYKGSEIVGQSFLTLVPEEYQAEAAQIFAVSAGEARAQGFRVQAAHKDGHQLLVNLFNAPILDSGGKIRAVVSTFEDVTQREETESQLRQAQKMEAIGHLTGGIAHDFNNLLGIIIGNLDLLQSARPHDAEVVDLAKEAMDAAARGAELTRRMLAFARRQPLQPQLVNINDLVRDISRLLSRVLRENITIDLALGEGVWPVVADPAQLEAALTNLGTNARDAMPRGGSLTFTTCNSGLDEDYALQHPGVVSGDYALIEVSDTGTGIPPSIMPRIFEPFFSTKERDQGTGLGLSMVFGFVKQSGGHINVYSEMGIGSTFKIYLPRAPETEMPQAVAPGRARSAGHLQSGTILVVEDNPALLRVAVRQLTELGYTVLSAGNATAALQVLEGGSVDLLFTDVIMPGDMDGTELANLVKSRWPSVRVLLTSGFPSPRNHEENLSQGLRFLPKPYLKQDLARAVADCLRT